ncbi:DUF6456 domain-containing protein [Marivita sp.]|uniref:DUF6456 domain-containing protein n=1 Tax=Marivita sp. TaxID=2003365 RepID=UPI003F6A7DC4
MTDLQHIQSRPGLSALFPVEARRYLAHTTEGRPLRDIAREAGCHASTVLRQVRKLETLRDDPLVDRVLGQHRGGDADEDQELVGLDAVTDAMRYLCQSGAMMLYREDVAQPAIVKTMGEGDTLLLGTVALDVAAALILRNWVAAQAGGSIKRYRITDEGRSVVPSLIAERDARAAQRQDDGFNLFSSDGPDRRFRNRSVSTGPGFESPLTALARRRGPDGKPFLPIDFVAAGDRLYEDYAIAGFAPSDLLGWDRPEVLQHLEISVASMTDTRRAEAFARTLDAVRDLGPGLSEVVLRCCCLREGLEATEKRLGWSARSGKVVLRIALQRLTLFYGRTLEKDAVLIG